MSTTVETPALQAHKEVMGLDLMRFAAASLVMTYHFLFWHWVPVAHQLTTLFPGRAPPVPALQFGWIGVEIFFVLSGFVIAYSASGATPARFLRSRVLRLAPGVWICATISLALYVGVLHRDLVDRLIAYASSVLFLPIRYIDDVYWTLSIEIAFYALVWFMLKRGRLDKLEPVMTVIGAGSGLFWVAALSLQTVLAGRTGALGLLHLLVLKAEGSRYFQLLLVQHGCLFATGVLLYEGFKHGFTPRRRLAAAGLIGACLLEIVGQTGIIARAAQAPASPLPPMAIWLCAVGLIALSVRYNAALQTRIPPLRRHARFLGQMTFPLYLLHNAVGLSLTYLCAPWLGVWAIGLGMAGSVLVAALVQATAEPVVRRGLAAQIDRLRAARLALGAAKPDVSLP